MNSPGKNYSTIGCCGIDCGLCPRFYTEGSSRCPGCGGDNFSEKHPSCGFLTCCTARHEVEVCALCSEFPCTRFDREKVGLDSFVTHQRMFANQEFIVREGLDNFLARQQQRIKILSYLLDEVNDGRSRNFYCLCSALLPLDSLYEVIDEIRKIPLTEDKKFLVKETRSLLQKQADKLGIELKLRK